MTEITIDNSKLPGVKEVVRDFGVLEDHTLAHTLQEQEIEHHLSTNIQRNRLVKHDLKVAKQLQEEEDLRAQTRLKKQHNELELLDVEIAQEIQEKLVIDAERRRRQEEKDEDIARLLQEREEKRKRSSREESQCSNHEGHRKGRHKEYQSEYDRPHRHDKHERQRKERIDPRSERSSPSSDVRSRGRSVESRSTCKEDDYGLHKPENPHHRASNKKERPERPPLPKTNKHDNVGSDNVNGEYLDEHPPESRRGRSQSHDIFGKHDSGNERHQDNYNVKVSKRSFEGDYASERQRRRTPSPIRERHPRDSGLRQREIRDAQQTKPSSGPKTREEYDAEIARKLQERELKVNVLDLQAAQLAQDEEIARWLMEKEEKAYRKSKSKEKMSDRRRPEEREPRSQEYVRPGTRESKESHRSRSDKPYRPLPPFPDEVGECDFEQDYTNRNQHNSPRSNSKSQSSHKGSSYRP
uniref:Coiled-coil domain containing 50 n=1 Tax=Leptobrachium leishanense TaxID=445787 RepID=A0A8C5QLF2_9ANUR